MEEREEKEEKEVREEREEREERREGRGGSEGRPEVNGVMEEFIEQLLLTVCIDCSALSVHLAGGQSSYITLLCK